MPRKIPDWMKRHRRAKYLIARWLGTPPWADCNATAAIYRRAKEMRAAGQNVHVDHIVPLCGTIVCGLHWHENLQIIESKLNHSKCNHTWPNMPNENLELIELEECEQLEMPL